MKRFLKYLNPQTVVRSFVILSLLFGNMPGLKAQDPAPAEKVSPVIKLSYRISDGKKSVKVQVSRKEDRKLLPVENIIVNLYHAEVKKYDPATADGWMGNKVTDADGICEFVFTEKFNQLTKDRHQLTFIGSIGSDPVYEDTQEEIVMTDYVIRLSDSKDDSLTTIVAALSRLEGDSEVVMPEAEMKLLVKRTIGMLPFGEEGLTTDENGEVSGTLPADLPGNPDNTITVVGRYEDADNEGIIEVSKKVAWNVPPLVSEWDERTMWASGSNAPIPLVVVTVSLILLIWGTIFYLVSFLFKIRRMR